MPLNSPQDRKGSSNIADIVGFVSLGGEPTYVGSASGFSLAMNLGQMVQATVWNKALSSAISVNQPRALGLADLKKHSAPPPNDDMGSRILDAYLTRVHLRYPFLDKQDLQKHHASRFEPPSDDPQDQFGTFKIYMAYAIGATMLKLTEAYDYTPPENFFMTALQYVSSARESHSVHNIEAMTLLVLYNLRSPSNSGIWYMIGLAMRTCIDLGMHREAHYTKSAPYEGQLRRRLFWSVYYLERTIANSLGRPYSLSDRDIDANMPLEIDDTVRDDNLIARTLAVANSPSFQASRPSSNLTMGIQCISIKRIESHIQTTIYRVDRPTSSLIPKIQPMLNRIEAWHNNIPPSPPYETDYMDMHYNHALRLLLQPFIAVLPPSSPHVARCMLACGQICQAVKRLHQSNNYGHSFVALHMVFIAGITMCYILFLSPALWTFTVSNDLRACSSALFVMAERTPSVKKYRDALESVISATMDHMSKTKPNPSSPPPSSSAAKKGWEREQSGGKRSGMSFMLNQGMSVGPTGMGGFPNSPYPMAGNGQVLSPPELSPKSHRERELRNTFPAPVPCPDDTRKWFDASSPSMDFGNSSGSGGGNLFGDGGLGEGNEEGLGQGLGGYGADMQQMDAEWLLSLCEGDGFSLQMLNDMMRFEPGLGT